MRDINELNKKIADLEKQRDALAEKTGGFKVGDKVVIEGVVSEIEDSYSHPLKVKMKGGLYDYFRPDHLRHAEAEPLYRLPLYRTPPDASKRIAGLENRCEKIKAEAKRWKEAYQECAESDSSTKMAMVVCDLVEARKKIEDLRDMLRGKNERIKELEADVESWKATWRLAYAENQDLRDMVAGKNARIDLLQDWLAKASAFKSKPTCDTTCDSPDKCCNTKPEKPATTVDGVATDHIVEPNKMVVAPKGVKENLVTAFSEVQCAMNLIEEDRLNPKHHDRLSVGHKLFRNTIKEIIELPEPSEWAVSITRLGVPPTEGCGLEFQGHELDIAAALIKAAQEVDNA